MNDNEITEDKNVKLSIYLSEELRTKFKMACTAKQTSMNQVILGFIENWTEENDPFRQRSPEPEGSGGKGKGKR